MEKEIYVILTHTGTMPSKIIKAYTHYKYSHVLISLNDKFDKMYSFGRKHLYNPLISGFVIEDINGKFFQRFKDTKARIYKITITDKQFIKLKHELDKFEERAQIYRYDFIGIASRLLRNPIKRKYHYICSEFVASVLDKSNIYKFNEKYEEVFPKDFEKLEELSKTEIIYEGLFRLINNNLQNSFPS